MDPSSFIDLACIDWEGFACTWSFQGVRVEFPTRLETRTKESNVHASRPAFMLVGEAHAKSTKEPSGSRTALLTGLSGLDWSLSMSC